MIRRLDHVNVRTARLSALVRFYADALGLVEGERPPLGFPGAWLYAGDVPILHVIGGKPRESLVTGVIDHMAFTAKGLADTIALLTAYDIEHVCRQQVGAGFWQVFFHDPNGARVELDFAADEVHAR